MCSDRTLKQLQVCWPIHQTSFSESIPNLFYSSLDTHYIHYIVMPILRLYAIGTVFQRCIKWGYQDSLFSITHSSSVSVHVLRQPVIISYTGSLYLPFSQSLLCYHRRWSPQSAGIHCPRRGSLLSCYTLYCIVLLGIEVDRHVNVGYTLGLQTDEQYIALVSKVKVFMNVVGTDRTLIYKPANNHVT